MWPSRGGPDQSFPKKRKKHNGNNFFARKKGMSTVPSSGRPAAGQVRTAALLDRRCPARVFPRRGADLQSGKYETRFVNVKLIVPFSLLGQPIGNFFRSR